MSLQLNIIQNKIQNKNPYHNVHKKLNNKGLHPNHDQGLHPRNKITTKASIQMDPTVVSTLVATNSKVD